MRILPVTLPVLVFLPVLSLSLTDLFPRELLDDLVFEELDNFLELLHDDFFDELLLDLDLLSSSTSLIRNEYELRM